MRSPESVSPHPPDLPSVLEGLPPFPTIALRVMQLVSAVDVRLKELSDLITADQSYSAQVLRLANSPMFGLRAEVRGILQAIVVLGVERIKALAFAAGIQTYLAKPLRDPLLAPSWRHSLASAIIAEQLGRISLIEEDVAYTAGLLHDIGRLALIAAQPVRYSKLVASAVQSPFDFLEAERHLFGIDHCEAGNCIVAKWKLPHILGGVASLHHSQPTDSRFEIVAVARTACQLADALGFAAVRPLQPLGVDEVIATLPDRERNNFVPLLHRHVVDINLKITSVE